MTGIAIHRVVAGKITDLWVVGDEARPDATAPRRPDVHVNRGAMLMNGRLVVSLLVGGVVAALVQLILDGSFVPERGTAVGVVAGLTGTALGVGMYLLLGRRAQIA
jgi:hypothetical protein